MSVKHPIISITGSSGAGTTSVTRTFENIFRRENVRAAIVEGDSFHRYDRAAMKVAMAEAETHGKPHFSHFGFFRACPSSAPEGVRSRRKAQP